MYYYLCGHSTSGTTNQYYTVAYSLQHVKTVFGCGGVYDVDKPGIYLPSSITIPTTGKYLAKHI
jgi:hypothetical protein